MKSEKNLHDSILDEQDLPLQPIKVPEWKSSAGKLFIQPLDGEDRFELSKIVEGGKSKKDNTYITEAYVCLGLVDKDGNRIFKLEERSHLARKNPEVIGRLFDAIRKASGMITADEDAAAKKSKRAPNSETGSE